MLTVLMVVDIVVSVILIASVLLQSGKSSGFAGLGGGESMFSGKPTDMDEALSRITVVFGLIFAVLNIVIARLHVRVGDGINQMVQLWHCLHEG